MIVDTLLHSAERAGKDRTISDPLRDLSYPDLVRLANIMRRTVESATTCERVGILLPASVAFAGAHFGTLWAGRIAVPLNFLLQPAELALVVADAGIDTIFAIKHFSESLAGLPDGIKVIYMEDLPLKREFVMDRLRSKPPAPSVSPDQTAVILYTSGTSGAPKGVVLSYGNLRTNADDCIRMARLDRDHNFLGILPLFHSFGLTAMLHAPIAAAASVHYMPRFSPQGMIKDIRERRSSVLMAIASMYTALLRVKSATKEDFASLIYPISGGEALPEATYKAFVERFGVDILQGYGMTETSPVVSLNTPWDHRVGSVGRAIPNVTVRAFDDDNKPVADADTGELWVQGPCVMQGYYKKPDETAAVKTDDHWLKTGDMGRVDEDGYIWITGRKKELIIVGGENVYPREIESVLAEHPAVCEAAAIGQQDPTRGETVAAFVTLHEGKQTTETELRDFCRGKLANYKIPRRVIISADLPRGPTGKILKRKLSDLL
jgi:long-chain acyl-CoA synthetase